jgi:hypothetical protein
LLEKYKDSCEEFNNARKGVAKYLDDEGLNNLQELTNLVAGPKSNSTSNEFAELHLPGSIEDRVGKIKPRM